MSTYYSRALFPSTNMNGNKLTNSEIKGYASRSRVGGQFAVVGKSCFKRSNSLKYCVLDCVDPIPNFFLTITSFLYNFTLLFSFFYNQVCSKLKKIKFLVNCNYSL